MTLLIWVVLGVFAIALFLLTGALIEMYRSLEQLRKQTGSKDFLTKMDVAADAATMESAGFPPGLFQGERGLLLILSDRCSTCGTLAERLAGALPEGVWIMLQPHSGESGASWLAEHDLDQTSRVIVDVDQSLADVIDIRITPTVIRFSAGEVTTAHTVPSPRRLSEELQWLRKGGSDPVYGPVHESFEAVNQMTKAAARSAAHES